MKFKHFLESIHEINPALVEAVQLAYEQTMSPQQQEAQPIPQQVVDQRPDSWQNTLKAEIVQTLTTTIRNFIPNLRLDEQSKAKLLDQNTLQNLANDVVAHLNSVLGQK